jgi:phospholipase/lecithinase/hemolysin
MAAAKPTFVSVWIGNNDVLGSLTSSTNPGDPALVTPVSTFQAQYQALVDTVAGTGARAILIGVADVSLIPYSTPGQVYYCLKTGACPGIPAGGFPPTIDVSPTCAPPPFAKGDSILVPWTVGITMLSAAAQGAHTTLDCSVDAEVVTPAEYKGLRDAVAGYNAFIQQQATAHGWAYLDVNPTLVASKADPALITTFPNLPSAATGGNVTFGSLFSLDGVHPSSAAHRVIADSIISAINATYKTTIPFAGP